MKNLLFITIILFIGCNCDKKDLIITKIPVKDSVEIQVKNDSIFLSIPYSVKIQNNCYKKIELPLIYYLFKANSINEEYGFFENFETSLHIYNKNNHLFDFTQRNYIQGNDYEEFHFHLKHKYLTNEFRQYKFNNQKILYNNFKYNYPILLDTIKKNNYLQFAFLDFKNPKKGLYLNHKIEW